MRVKESTGPQTNKEAATWGYKYHWIKNKWSEDSADKKQKNPREKQKGQEKKNTNRQKWRSHYQVVNRKGIIIGNRDVLHERELLLLPRSNAASAALKLIKLKARTHTTKQKKVNRSSWKNRVERSKTKQSAWHSRESKQSAPTGSESRETQTRRAELEGRGLRLQLASTPASFFKRGKLRPRVGSVMSPGSHHSLQHSTDTNLAPRL